MPDPDASHTASCESARRTPAGTPASYGVASPFPFGWFSLRRAERRSSFGLRVGMVPPLVTLGASVAMRQVVLAMLLGIWSGALLLNGFNPVVAVLVAWLPDHRLVLVEQYRKPIERMTIELPAGLVGDQRDQADDDGTQRALGFGRRASRAAGKDVALLGLQAAVLWC